jgi:dolichyl-phosphate beta-glucosyltransferase
MSAKAHKNISFDLTIVIPAYHEELRIEKTLNELSQFIKKDRFFRDKSIEIIVVAADSTDKTHQMVESMKNKFKALRLLKPGSRVGKGRDVKYGMLRAKGKAVIFMDADLATPLKYLGKFYDCYSKGSDIVIATRNLHRHHPNMIRRLISNLGNLLYRLASGVWIEDSQCGFKLFSSNACQLCFSKLTILGWGFDMEILAIAKANKLKVKTYRINDWKAIPGGSFADNILKNSIKSLYELAYIFWNRLFNKYVDK